MHTSQSTTTIATTEKATIPSSTIAHSIDDLSFPHTLWVFRLAALNLAINNKGVDPGFRDYCLSQFHDTGRNNATPFITSSDITGLYGDVYRREVDLGKSELSGRELSTFVSISKKYDLYRVLYEPSMQKLVDCCMKRLMTPPSQPYAGHPILVKSTDIVRNNCIIASSLLVSDYYFPQLLGALSRIGALLNNDKLTLIAGFSIKNRDLFLGDIIKQRSGMTLSIPHITMPLFNQVNHSKQIILGRIKQTLNNQLSIADKKPSAAQFYFYYNLLLHLVNAIDETSSPDNEIIETQNIFAIQRFEYLLKASIAESEPHALDSGYPLPDGRGSMELNIKRRQRYFQWINHVTLMMDELMFVFGSHRRDLTVAQVQTKVADYIELTTKVRPSFATIASSGMQSITTAVSMARDALLQEQNYISIYISNRNYFEIIPAMKLILNTSSQISESSSGTLFLTSNQLPLTAKKPSPLIHLIIGSVYSNVLTDCPGNHFTDLLAQIKSQLQLREQNNITSRLYVIIDRTMEAADDMWLDLLHLAYESSIQSGRLIILGVSSCNKFFSCGLDKTPAGFIYALAELSKNKPLSDLINNMSDEHRLGGFAPHDVTVQTIMQLFNVNDLLNEYNSLLRDRTRHLYHKVVQNILLTSPFFISLDSPETCPQDENSSLISSECWPFLAIRFNSFKECEQLKENLYVFLSKIVERLGIHKRDGFAFAETTMNFVLSNKGELILRINIGTEAIDDLTLLFSEISIAINLLNQQLLHHLPGEKRKDDMNGVKEERIYDAICERLNMHMESRLGLKTINRPWESKLPVAISGKAQGSVSVGHSAHSLFSTNNTTPSTPGSRSTTALACAL